MKTRNIYILAGLFAFGAFFTGCDDDDDGKAVAITVKNATNLKEDIFGVVVTEDQPVQLNPFVMPESARAGAVSYHFAGEPTGAIDLSADGLITPKLTTSPTGDIPYPLGTATIIVRVDDGSGTYVKYPNGVVTITGQVGETTNITVTANDRGKQSATARVKVAAEAPLYVAFPYSVDKWKVSSNVETQEGDILALFDGKNSTFWVPKIGKRPLYDVVAYLDLDLGQVIKFGQFGYMHRSLNYAWLQCHTFKLEAKKEAADAWTDLGNFETEALKVEDYQLFEVDPIEVQYIRLTFIKGHLRPGSGSWGEYSESGSVCVGDVQVSIYNR